MKKNIIDLEYWLNLSYEEFYQKKGKVYDKLYYPTREKDFYEIIENRNQFMFQNDHIYMIEFNNIAKFKKEFILKNTLNSTLKYFTEKKINWAIFSKYSYNHFLVIKVSNFIFLEYEFDTKWNLILIRISSSEEDNG